MSLSRMTLFKACKLELARRTAGSPPTRLVGGLGRWKGGLGNPKGTKGGLGNPKGGLPSQPLSPPTQPVHHGSCRCMFSPHATSLQTSRDTRNNKRQKYELSLFSMTWTMTKTTSKNLDLHCFSSICGMTTSKVQNCLHCFFSLCGIAGP